MAVMGAPTKYSQEVLDTAADYVVNFADYEDAVPTVSGLAIVIGTHRDTIYDWAKQEDKSDFSDIVKMLTTNQERKLINGGLNGSMNPTIAKLLLAKHGHSDKVETDITSGGEKLNHPGYTIVDE